MWADESTARRATQLSPSAVTTPTARPFRTVTRSTARPTCTRPPFDSIARTSASGSAPEPPMGVAHPKLFRPEVIENGRMPVPGCRMSVIVANDSQVSRSRACAEPNRSAMTSWALRERSASYAASSAEAAGSSRPAFHRAWAAARPPSQSASSRRYASPSAGFHRASSAAVVSRSRDITIASPSASGSTTAGSVCT